VEEPMMDWVDIWGRREGGREGGREGRREGELNGLEQMKLERKHGRRD
jgi:hypothetical protein